MLLGIDVGTSSSKGVLVERDGTIVALTTVEHKVSMPGPGTSSSTQPSRGLRSAP
jgi:xylulokinase